MTKKFSAFTAKTLLSQMSSLAGLDAAGTANAKLAIAALLASGGALVGVQFLTANGTYTPTVGAKSALIIACGGGGGGGGIGTTAGAADAVIAGGTGGAGELRVIVLPLAVASYVYTNGSNGPGGGIGSDGTAGGDTKFNDGSTDVFVCKGGALGALSAGAASGANGANGTGGTGGVSLQGLVNRTNLAASLNGIGVGAWNFFFGSPPLLPALMGSTAGAPVFAVGQSGAVGQGRGSGGVGGQKYGTSTTGRIGGNATAGCSLVVEFG